MGAKHEFELLRELTQRSPSDLLLSTRNMVLQRKFGKTSEIGLTKKTRHNSPIFVRQKTSQKVCERLAWPDNTIKLQARSWNVGLPLSCIPRSHLIGQLPVPDISECFSSMICSLVICSHFKTAFRLP